MPAFLYKWTEKDTGKWYVGSRTAQGCHINDGYICSSKYVLPLIQKNPTDWCREILIIGNAKYIVALEASYLQLLNARDDKMSYNRSNADGKFNTTGTTHSEEVKAAMSANRSGVLNSNYGNKMSVEAKAKISTANTGKVRSEELKAQLSNTLKGRKKSDEHKIRIGKAHKGRKFTDEHLANMSTGTKAVPHITCPHCGKVGDRPNMARWHFDNCKVAK